jgi:small GTP-binding protein
VVQKKIALLGAPGVGKTSLVRRYVQSLFDDAYLSTIGVKVDKKLLQAGGQDVTLMIWDVAGAEEHFSVPPSYVRGAAGYLLVVDGTRPETLEAGVDLVESMPRELGPLPAVLVLNKADLADAWRLDDAAVTGQRRWPTTVRASAKTGEGVEEAFVRLAEATLRHA